MTITKFYYSTEEEARIAAKNNLDCYCLNMKSTMEDEKVKEKITDSDKEAINSKCDEIIKWLEANQLAEVDKFQEKQKEVEGICDPIITKLQEDGGSEAAVEVGICLLEPSFDM